jgi:importin subunit alpha-1
MQCEDSGKVRERLDGESLNESAPQRRGSHSIIDLVDMLKSEDISRQLFGARGIRKMLQKGKIQLVQRIISAGTLPRLVDLLDRDEIPRLQLECCWALTNIAGGSSEHTRAVVEAGAVPALVRLMRDGDESVRDQPVWALGHISGDCAEHRDLVLANGALEVLVDDIMAPQRFAAGAAGMSSTGDSALEHATWALLNLVRIRPLPSFERVRGSLQRLRQLLHFEESPDVMRDACWALAAISESIGAQGCVRTLLDLGVVRRCVDLLASDCGDELSKPALRVVGNACAGDDDVETQEVIDTGVVPLLGRLALSHDQVTRKETFWTLSNMAAGGPRQVEAVFFAHPDIVPCIIKAALTDSPEVAREAVWALANATAGTPDQVCRLVTEHGCIEALGSCLKTHRHDPVAQSVALEGLENVIKIFVAENTDDSKDALFVGQVKRCGLVETLRTLRESPEQQVADLAHRILVTGGVEEMIMV